MAREGGGSVVAGAVLHRSPNSETTCWVEWHGQWIGNVCRYDGRWEAARPGEPWNVDIGTAATRAGAVRLLIAAAMAPQGEEG